MLILLICEASEFGHTQHVERNFRKKCNRSDCFINYYIAEVQPGNFRMRLLVRMKKVVSLVFKLTVRAGTVINLK